MIYRLFRWISGIALRWFYRDIRIIGRERGSLKGPLLIAANHQNALVDSLIVGWVMPRRIAMTAKATLTDNFLVAVVFKWLHVIPLRRSRDEMATKNGAEPDRARNARAFEEMINLLRKQEAILIFPEGKSHNERGLEPLKTGLARLALQTRDVAGVQRVKILPIGLTFEDKGTPGTVVVAHIGDPIDMDRWPGDDHVALTREIASRLRKVCERAPAPTSTTKIYQRKDSALPETLISLAAWWGRTTHRLPIRLARNIAVHRSTDDDQPAMLTILFGIGLVALTYVLQVAVIGFLFRSTFIAGLYLATLLCGAYYAAFEQYGKKT
jgi:1-acyl-sn-glycerol-3-phosphate acyltransferase